MTEVEIKTEKPYKILEIVKEIFDFNKKKSKTTWFGTKNTNPKPNA